MKTIMRVNTQHRRFESDSPVVHVSLGTAGVVVGHEAEAVHHRRQLLKLLPAKHPRLPAAAQAHAQTHTG